jgi:predicted metal-dependent phosphoesterase TrpH
MSTAVEFMASELLYLDNEYDMKLINKNEYQAKRKEIIEQAKQMDKEQVIKHSLELAKILISNPIEVSGKTPQELFEQYYNETFKSE